MANEIIKGMGFHHVALKAVDFDAALKFYTEGLGMKFYTTWGEGNGKIAMNAILKDIPGVPCWTQQEM